MRMTIFILMLWSGLSHGQEAVVTLRSTVTGNQEQPKVMYIVPWQPPEYREFQYAPAARLTEELFSQIDRGEFVRELEYREILAQPATDAGTGD